MVLKKGNKVCTKGVTLPKYIHFNGSHFHAVEVEPDAQNLLLINGHFFDHFQQFFRSFSSFFQFFQFFYFNFFLFAFFCICAINFEPIRFQTSSAPQNDRLNFSFLKDILIVVIKCQEMVIKQTFKPVANFGHQALVCIWPSHVSLSHWGKCFCFFFIKSHYRS